jgi:hypothetical protein
MARETSSAAGKLGWLPGATAILTFIACNGLIILVAILSVFGITVAINPHVQAGVISLFAALTLAFVFLGYRTHHARGPMIISTVGAVLVIGSMYIYFNKIIESAGLLALIASAVWSWRASRTNAEAA